MKPIKISLFCIFYFIISGGNVLYTQVPPQMKYESVVRNPQGSVLVSSNVGLRLSVLKGSVSGYSVYEEIYNTMTDENGVVSVVLGGGGTPVGALDTVDWSKGSHFLKVEIDQSGGTNYAVAGVSQLLSVPFVFQSRMTDSVAVSVSATGDTVFIGNKFVIAPGVSKANTPPPVAPAPAYSGGYVHCLGGGDTTEIVEVTNALSGMTWMDRNLGASRVATAYNDAESYGDLFQWGRFADGHQCARGSNVSATTSTLATSAGVNSGDAWYGKFVTVSGSPYDWLNPQDDNLWQGVAGENNPCPAGYRLPTAAEWETERNTWNEFNSSGAMASPLKLPAAGYRNGSSGALVNIGSNGFYWSSSVSGSDARNLNFYSGVAYLTSYYRAYGYSVRCLKDTL